MKKITLVVKADKAGRALAALRKIGVLHIKNLVSPRSDHIDTFRQRLQDVDKALGILSGVAPDSEKSLDVKQADCLRLIHEIISLSEQAGRLKGRVIELNRRKDWFKEWGNISWHNFIELKSRGLFISLYQAKKSQLKSVPRDKAVFIAGRKKGMTRLVLIAFNSSGRLDFQPVPLPQESLKRSRKKLLKAQEELKCAQKRLAYLAVYKERLLVFKKELNRKLEFCLARFGMKDIEGLGCLQGFCPADRIQEIRGAASSRGWAFVNQEPDEPQEVPTLIKYPRWAKIIEPVFRFMGTLPGYKETDISPWFLLFFSVFFALLIGDAGYGFLFLILTFFASRRFPSAPKEPFRLLYVLSGATIIWGALTGTWFGAEAIAKIPFFSTFVIERINTFTAANQPFIIYICFVIGGVQLSIAHIIKALGKSNSLKSLAHIGWVGVIWTTFFIADKLVLSGEPKPWSLYMGLAGAGLVILFSDPQKNIFKSALKNLANFPLKAISSFSDVVSYLRLFAVGYATVAVAGTFNQMALGSGVSGVFSGFIAALILFLGHSLNVILCIMSVLVHGIRLNMLEFSSHLEMEWSGIPYEPFRE